MAKIKITILGMHCASCSNNVEKSLGKVKGVKSASVSLMLNRGIIESEGNVSEEEIKKAVSKVGYKVINLEKV